jgi:hypothetical protein
MENSEASWNLKLHNLLKSGFMYLILIHFNLLKSYFSKIYFKVILASASRFPKLFLFLTLFRQYFLWSSQFSRIFSISLISFHTYLLILIIFVEQYKLYIFYSLIFITSLEFIIILLYFILILQNLRKMFIFFKTKIKLVLLAFCILFSLLFTQVVHWLR